MVTMLSNSLVEQLSVNRRTCHIAMKVVSADSICSLVWWDGRADCAEVSEVSTGSVEASKARLGFRSHILVDTLREIILRNTTEDNNNKMIDMVVSLSLVPKIAAPLTSVHVQSRTLNSNET
jgi:hypothetical protein